MVLPFGSCWPPVAATLVASQGDARSQRAVRLCSRLQPSLAAHACMTPATALPAAAERVAAVLRLGAFGPLGYADGD